MGSIFGGGKKTETSQPAPASAEERKLQAEALVTAQIRNQLLREQITAQTGAFDVLGRQLEGGIAQTLGEEDRFGILAGETLGPGAVDQEEPSAAPPASAQIGAPGAEPTVFAGAAELAELEKRLGEKASFTDPQGVTRQVGGALPGGLQDRIARLRAEQTKFETAQQDTAIQTAVQEALAERGTAQLKQSVLQLSTTDAKTPAGEGIRQQLLQKQLDLIERGGRATPEDIADIKRAANAASEEGAIALRNFADRLLVDIRDVLTPARGLRPQDTPIREEGGRVGAEATRQFGELQARLRTVQAQQELTLPLARQGFQAQLTGFQQNLTQAAREFQVGLRQQAFENRLRLAATSSAAFGTLLGTPGVNVNFPRGTTTTTSGGGNVLGGVSGLLQGLGSIGFSPFGAAAGAGASSAAPLGFFAGTAGAVVGSSRLFKEHNEAIDADDILSSVNRLSIERWTYKPEMEMGLGEHIGPYAEDFRAAFAVGDGTTINMLDAVGVLFAAVQALTARLKELEA